MSDTIIYEHPLTEKMRCYLRIESLNQQLLAFRDIDDEQLFKPFFNLLFSLAEQMDRGEFKKELIRDIDTHKHALEQLRHDENIDGVKLEELITRLSSFDFSAQPSKLQTLITHDDLLCQIKNKATLPGGGCQFDTPLLHYWLHQPFKLRQQDISRWLDIFSSTLSAVHLLLQLTRESKSYQTQVANEGFFQSNSEKTQLLRIKLSVQQGCYPTVSGYRTRYSIRFVAWNEQPLHDINFDLACC